MPEVKCPNGHKLNVPDAYLGQEVRCSVCNATFVTPTGGEPEGAAPSSPAPESPAIGAAASGAPVTEAGPAIANSSSVTQRHRERVGRGGLIGWLDSERLGKPLLFLGLILVILARGCDGLGARWANRLRARADAAPRKFQQKTSRMLRDKDAAKKSDINKQRSKERDELADKWADLSDSASNARSNHAQWAFLYHVMFVFGSLSLAFGLLVVGFNGNGSERLICLIMIAIITASIYIAGVPWLEGMFSTMGVR